MMSSPVPEQPPYLVAAERQEADPRAKMAKLMWHHQAGDIDEAEWKGPPPGAW